MAATSSASSGPIRTGAKLPASFVPSSSTRVPTYIGGYVYKVEIDGKSTGINSTFISSPFTFGPGDEKKVWAHAYLQTVNQYGVADNGIPPGCHEFKFTVDPENRVVESNECNNAHVIYFATGNATCGADKKSGSVTTCKAPPSVAKPTAVPTSATPTQSVKKPVAAP
jgi:hypothetical protein